ncbi:MAG: hypothetical protein ACOYN0_17565 [Phycisphaerales bacterium]
MQQAPRHNHRWQRALAWVCLLLASATAVPIGASFVAGWNGVVLASPPTIWVRGPTLGLTEGALTRAYLKPDSLRGFEIGPLDTLVIAAARKFGTTSAWRVRWDASDSDLWFAVPVWWVPLAFCVASLWLRFRTKGLFARKRSGGRVIVATAMLFTANAVAAIPRINQCVTAEYLVPPSGPVVGVHRGWLVVGNDRPSQPSESLPSPFLPPSIEDLEHGLSGARIGVDWSQWSVFYGVQRYWAVGIATWWLNIALGTALLWIGIRAYRRGRDPDACPVCGYSRAGLASRTCPECGKAPAKETLAEAGRGRE